MEEKGRRIFLSELSLMMGKSPHGRGKDQYLSLVWGNPRKRVVIGIG
jgi:hypothetical protein